MVPPSSTKPVEFWWIWGTFQDSGRPVYSLGAIMGFHVISNYRHFCWMFLKTEAHRCRHGRMKMSVIHVRPRIQTTVHLIVSVIPLHDFIVLLDLLFNVWKFALQVLAALLLLKKRRVLEERRDTRVKPILSTIPSYLLSPRRSHPCKIHHKLHRKEQITSNSSRIFYMSRGIENNRRVKDSRFSSCDIPEGFGWFDPPPTHRGKKTLLKLQRLDGAVKECGGWRGSLLGGRKSKHNWGNVEQLKNKKSARSRNPGV